MIVNVSSTHTAIVTSQLSRHDLLAWVNSTLKAEFNKVDELCTGAAYCQLMHSLYPKLVPIKRVKFCTNIEHEFIDNFKILQAIFQKLNVQKTIPIDRLVRGKFQDNIEFLQWFKKFYDANYTEREYDAIGVRCGQPMAYGATNLKKKPKSSSPRGVVQQETQDQQRQQDGYMEQSSENVEACTFQKDLASTVPRRDLLRSPDMQIEDRELKSVYLAQAQCKLEQIFTLCMEAQAMGSNSVEIDKIEEVIFKRKQTGNNLVNGCSDADEHGAGDFVEIKDVIENA